MIEQWIKDEIEDFRRMDRTEAILEGTEPTPWLVVSAQHGVVGGAPDEQEARHLVEEIGEVCWIIDLDNNTIEVKP